ncbi:hypothetical protein J2Z22_002804 [Paenibacillus forsythiae]|uniref:Uncharacterized protein n=1 Tax=Paenibacillus forsythiae TaxID=365616 RepID=A0ABU3H8V4_9BACL|nr:hypothetical protein [Paenibacillus forsythiae]MDT3427253.1 hypothetical protein [Paenibacillus forsythiae]
MLIFSGLNDPGSEPLYIQLYEFLKREIMNGNIPGGDQYTLSSLLALMLRERSDSLGSRTPDTIWYLPPFKDTDFAPFRCRWTRTA